MGLCTYRCVKKCTTTNVVRRHLVAMSLSVTWNLHSVSDRSVVVEVNLLTLARRLLFLFMGTRRPS